MVSEHRSARTTVRLVPCLQPGPAFVWIIVVYFTLKNLPKEYEIFKRMQIAGQSLPSYEHLEAKLISEETAIRIETQAHDDSEAFFSHHDRSRRSQPPRFNHPPRHYGYQRSTDLGGRPVAEAGARSSRHQPPPQSQTTAPRTSLQPAYQPKYRPRGPEKPRNNKCNFCGLDGHFERECDLRSILDRMKDYESRLM